MGFVENPSREVQMKTIDGIRKSTVLGSRLVSRNAPFLRLIKAGDTEMFIWESIIVVVRDMNRICSLSALGTNMLSQECVTR